MPLSRITSSCALILIKSQLQFLFFSFLIVCSYPFFHPLFLFQQKSCQCSSGGRREEANGNNASNQNICLDYNLTEKTKRWAYRSIDDQFNPKNHQKMFKQKENFTFGPVPKAAKPLRESSLELIKTIIQPGKDTKAFALIFVFITLL